MYEKTTIDIVVAPRLLIKSVPPSRNEIAVGGSTIAVRELWPMSRVWCARCPSTTGMWDSHQAAQQHNAYGGPNVGV
jgi:hypothetical protein